MPDYDLGKAHGEVNLDYDNTGIKKAKDDLDALGKKSGQTSDEIDASAAKAAQAYKVLGQAAKSLEADVSRYAAAEIVAKAKLETAERSLSTARAAAEKAATKAEATENVLTATRNLAAARADDIDKAEKTLKAARDSGVASATQIKSAEETLTTARANAVSVQEQLAAAEKKIETVRTRATTTAERAASAERTFQTATARSADASDKVRNATDSLHSARTKLGAYTPQVDIKADESKLNRLAESVFNIDKNTKSGLGGLNSFVGRTQALGAAIALALPQVAGLGVGLSQVAQAAALAPAALSAAAAAFATIKVGTSGLGDAFKEANKAAIGAATAMDQVSPKARDLVNAVVAQRKAWQDVQFSVQDALLRGAAPAIQAIAGTYLPLLKRGMTGVATELNVVAHGFKEFLLQGQTTRDVSTIFDMTRLSVRNLSDGLQAVMLMFRDLAAVGATFLPGLASGFSNVAQKAADYVSRMRETGNIAQFIQTGIDAVKKLGEILGNLVGIVVTVFTALDASGGGFLNLLASLTGQLNDFLRGAEGQAFLIELGKTMAVIGSVGGKLLFQILEAILPLLTAFGPLIQVVAQAFGAILTPAIAFIAPALDEIAKFISKNIDWIGPLVVALGIWAAAQWLVNAAYLANPVVLAIVAIIAAIVLLVAAVIYIKDHWSQISTFFKNLWNDVWRWTSDRLTAIRDFFVNIWNSIVAFFQVLGISIGQTVTGILDWFASLPTKIGEFLLALPQQLWDLFTSALGMAVTAVIQGIEWIIALHISIPLRILEALGQLGVWLGGLFADAWNWAWKVTSDVITRMVDDAIAFPGRVVNGLAVIGQWISDLFRNAWNWAWKTTTDVVNGLIAWVEGIPRWINDRLSGLASWLGDTARNAWNRFKENAQNVGNDFLNWVQGIPRWVMDRLGDLGNLLYGAGKAIIDGLLNGIKAAVRGMLDFVGGIASKIIATKGPLPYDKTILIPAGLAIMDGLHRSLRAGFKTVIAFVSSAAGQLADAASVDLNNTMQLSATSGIAPNALGAAGIASILAPLPAGGSARGTDGSSMPSVVHVENLNLQVTGNLDPTNPTAWRAAIVNIKDGIRSVERQTQ